MTVPKKPNINDILGTSIVEGGGKGGGFGVDFSSFKNWWNAKATEKALKKLKIQRKKQREEVDKELSSKVKVAQEGLEGFNTAMGEMNQANLANYYRLKTDGRISVDPEVKKIIPPKTPEQYKLDLKKAKKKGGVKNTKKIEQEITEISSEDLKDLGKYNWKRTEYLQQYLANSKASYILEKKNLAGKSDDGRITALQNLGININKNQLKSVDEVQKLMDINASTPETFLKWVHSMPRGSKL